MGHNSHFNERTGKHAFFSVKQAAWHKVGQVIENYPSSAEALKFAGLDYHNHPSGNLQPSEQDKRLTQRVKEAGRILDIPVLDHVIMTADGYYSFADEGEL